MQRDRRGVPRTVTWHDVGQRFGEAAKEAVRRRSKYAGSWMPVRIWKQPHVDADQRAAALHSGIVIATLVREPDNQSDGNAVQVWLDGVPIGHVEAYEAAHFQPVFAWSGDAVELPVRRSKRVKSPHFDIFMPDPHNGFEEYALCEVCKTLAAESRRYRYGP